MVRKGGGRKKKRERERDGLRYLTRERLVGGGEGRRRSAGWNGKKRTNFTGIPGKMYLRLRCNRGALARGGSAVLPSTRSRFVPPPPSVSSLTARVQPRSHFDAVTWSHCCPRFSRRLRRRSRGRNLRPRPGRRRLGDGAPESEEFGPSGVLN